MKKVDKKYIHIGIIAFLVICASICFYFLLVNRSTFVDLKNNFLKIMLPIIDGVCLAYLLNPLNNKIERDVIIPISNKIYKDKSKINSIKHKKHIRAISITLTELIFFLIVAGLILLIVPQLLESIQSIIIRFPAYVNSFSNWADHILVKYPELQQWLDNYWSNITDYATQVLIPKLQEILSTVSSTILGSVYSIFVFVFKLLIGIILSIYLLFSKELYLGQAKKIAYSLLNEERANNLINNTRFANKTFGGFISGKIVDSIIIGILCFIGTTLLQIPYALLISVIVGVTNIIPFFGPYLGAVPSAFIILMISPKKCLCFLIFVLILQQVDGNIIGPKILGDSTGLSSFWVIFSITVFGGYFGVVGMIIGVPVFAIIYAAFRTFVDTRLEKKSLPIDTTYYMSSDFHSEISDIDNYNGKKIKFVNKTFDGLNSGNNNSNSHE